MNLYAVTRTDAAPEGQLRELWVVAPDEHWCRNLVAGDSAIRDATSRAWSSATVTFLKVDDTNCKAGVMIGSHRVLAKPTHVVSPQSAFAYPRPHGTTYHLVRGPWDARVTACSLEPVYVDLPWEVQDVPAGRRCQRTGCRVSWPRHLRD